MATLIKSAPKPVNTFNVGDWVDFTTWIPLQNVGMQPVLNSGTVIKVNRKTVDVVDRMGNTWRVGMDEVH